MYTSLCLVFIMVQDCIDRFAGYTMSLRPSLFFDAKDYEILRLVNAYMERRGTMPFDEKQHIYRASLHPHGIKELATSKEVRTAEAVIDLLSSLEAGQTTDRTNALKTLHDEVDRKSVV